MTLCLYTLRLLNLFGGPILASPWSCKLNPAYLRFGVLVPAVRGFNRIRYGVGVGTVSTESTHKAFCE